MICSSIIFLFSNTAAPEAIGPITVFNKHSGFTPLYLLYISVKGLSPYCSNFNFMSGSIIIGFGSGRKTDF